MVYKKIGHIVLSLSTIAMLIGCDSKPSTTEQAPIEQIDANEQDPSTNVATNNDEVEAIRNATLPNFSNSLTIAQAFEHWKGCSNPTWESKTGDRGERMVMFKCQIDNYMVGEPTDGDSASMIFNANPAGIKVVDAGLGNKLKNIEAFVAFNISVDGSSFEAVSSATKVNFKDGKSYISESTNVSGELGVLNQIYKNIMPYLAVSNDNYKNRQ